MTATPPARPTATAQALHPVAAPRSGPPDQPPSYNLVQTPQCTLSRPRCRATHQPVGHALDNGRTPVVLSTRVDGASAVDAIFGRIGRSGRHCLPGSLSRCILTCWRFVTGLLRIYLRLLRFLVVSLLLFFFPFQ